MVPSAAQPWESACMRGAMCGSDGGGGKVDSKLARRSHACACLEADVTCALEDEPGEGGERRGGLHFCSYQKKVTAGWEVGQSLHPSLPAGVAPPCPRLPSSPPPPSLPPALPSTRHAHTLTCTCAAPLKSYHAAGAPQARHPERGSLRAPQEGGWRRWRCAAATWPQRRPVVLSKRPEGCEPGGAGACGAASWWVVCHTVQGSPCCGSMPACPRACLPVRLPACISLPSVSCLCLPFQAVGRVIRHRRDYGAIILCDERFKSPVRCRNSNNVAVSPCCALNSLWLRGIPGARRSCTKGKVPMESRRFAATCLRIRHTHTHTHLLATGGAALLHTAARTASVVLLAARAGQRVCHIWRSQRIAGAVLQAARGGNAPGERRRLACCLLPCCPAALLCCHCTEQPHAGTCSHPQCMLPACRGAAASLLLRLLT